jgi:hypothetical protein
MHIKSIRGRNYNKSPMYPIFEMMEIDSGPEMYRGNTQQNKLKRYELNGEGTEMNNDKMFEFGLRQGVSIRRNFNLKMS